MHPYARKSTRRKGGDQEDRFQDPGRRLGLSRSAPLSASSVLRPLAPDDVWLVCRSVVLHHLQLCKTVVQRQARIAP